MQSLPWRPSVDAQIPTALKKKGPKNPTMGVIKRDDSWETKWSWRKTNMVNLMKSNMAVGCDGKFPQGYVSCYKI